MRDRWRILHAMGCAYCGSETEKTDEHVYAKWMREASYATGQTRMTLGDDPKPKRTYTGLYLALKDGVCRTCNNGWLSRLENRVKPWLAPAIRGEAMALAPETQPAVAAWACGKALLIELAMRQWRKAFYAPESNLRWLYEHRDDPIPPPGSQVWLAHVDAEFGEANSLTGFNKAALAPERPADPEVYLATFAVGYLVLQVAGQDFREPDHLSRTGESLMELARPDTLLPFLRSVWPQRDDLVVWPPSHGLRKTDLPRFGNWDDTIYVRRRTVRIPDIK